MTKFIDNLPDVLTTKEIAHLLRVSPITVRRWANKGLLPRMMVGIRPRFLKKDVLKLLKFI